MKKEAIVFIGHGASRTGAPASLLKIVKWIAKHTDHTCFVIIGNNGPLVEDYSKYASVHIWNKPISGRPMIFNELLARFPRLEFRSLDRHRSKIIRQLRAQNVRCIFNNTGVNGHILEMIKPVVNAPVISRIPELEAYMRKNNRNGSVDKVLSLTDHFVAVSNAVRNNLIENHSIAPKDVSIIYGACDTEKTPKNELKLHENLGIPPDAFLVGGCGTLDYRKGIDLFIQVANYCKKKLLNQEVYFCWIGACISQESSIEYKYEVEQLSLNSHFFFLGEIVDTAPYFAELDVFLLTSREDPFPLVMLEAARQGTPIICFEEGGGATEFVDNTLGMTVGLLDIESMARSIITIKDSPDLQVSLSAKAYEKSLNYTPEIMGKEIYDVISNLRVHSR